MERIDSNALRIFLTLSTTCLPSSFNVRFQLITLNVFVFNMNNFIGLINE